MKEKEFRKYPKYKTSGVEWIGEIPEHWGIIKLKYIVNYEKGKNAAIFTKEYIGQNYGDYPVYSGQTEDNGILGTITTYEYDVQRALLITTVGAKAMTLRRIGSKFSLSQNCAILFPKDNSVNLDYYYYYLDRHFDFEKGRISLIMQPSLRFEDLDTYTVILPPLPEQTAIANFLDDKTAKIDSLIEKKKKLIELYKEEKTAVINHYVLGQHLIDNSQLAINNSQLTIDNYPLSIINYKLPKHWELKKLKYVAKVNPSKKSYSFQKDSTEEVVFLPMEKVSENGNIFQNIKKQISDVSSGFTYFERDDIIFAKITPCFENGKAALLNNLETYFGFGSTEFHTLRNSDMILKEFLFLIIKSHRFMKIGEAFMSGAAGQKRVPAEFVKDFTTLIPTLFEQQQIVEYIESETKRIDNKIARAEKEIELLQEYRTALISEVVTGKIKVIDN
jgi:type I restriction enzyme S subunit